LHFPANRSEKARSSAVQYDEFGKIVY
jgi:hypothetical protein